MSFARHSIKIKDKVEDYLELWLGQTHSSKSSLRLVVGWRTSSNSQSRRWWSSSTLCINQNSISIPVSVVLNVFYSSTTLTSCTVFSYHNHTKNFRTHESGLHNSKKLGPNSSSWIGDGPQKSISSCCRDFTV